MNKVDFDIIITEIRILSREAAWYIREWFKIVKRDLICKLYYISKNSTYHLLLTTIELYMIALLSFEHFMQLKSFTYAALHKHFSIYIYIK